tara:strand:- start:795 stop:1748 length:954 start_codon:yes stop_codon:yes gene_type:complete
MYKRWLGFLIIAVDIGGTQIRVALLDEKFNILTKKSFSTGIDSLPDRSCSMIAKEIEELKYSYTLSDFKCVGISTPSFNRLTGKMINPPNLPRWNNFPVVDFFKSSLGLPVVAGNDASLAAWGEYKSGAGQGVQNLVYFTLSTGIGGGLIINEELYEGTMGFSGEIGHISVVSDGELCKCGNRGCLELYASGPAILRAAISRIKNGESTSLKINTDLTSEDVFIHARRGDLVSNKIVSDVGTYLGQGVVNVMNMFEPQRIVFGGGVSESFDLLKPHILNYVERYAMTHFEKSIDLRKSELNENSSLIGAAYYASMHQ